MRDEACPECGAAVYETHRQDCSQIDLVVRPKAPAGDKTKAEGWLVGASTDGRVMVETSGRLAFSVDALGPFLGALNAAKFAARAIIDEQEKEVEQ